MIALYQTLIVLTEHLIEFKYTECRCNGSTTYLASLNKKTDRKSGHSERVNYEIQSRNFH